MKNTKAKLTFAMAAVGLLAPAANAGATTISQVTDSKAPVVKIVDAKTGVEIKDSKTSIHTFTRASASDDWVTADKNKLAQDKNIAQLLKGYKTDSSNLKDSTLSISIDELSSDSSHEINPSHVILSLGKNGWVLDGGNTGVTLKDGVLTITNDSLSSTQVTNSSSDSSELISESSSASSPEISVPAPAPSSTVTNNSTTVTESSSTSSVIPAVTSSIPTTVAAVTSSTSIKAAAASTGVTISGTVFKDANGDGDFNGNDSSYSAATVTLVNANDNSTVQTVKTDSKGAYTFSNVDPGSYNVRVSTPSGSHFTRVYNDVNNNISNSYAGVDVSGDDNAVTNVDFGVALNTTTDNPSNSASPTSTPSSTSTSSTPVKTTTPAVPSLPTVTKTPTATSTSNTKPIVKPSTKPTVTKTPTTAPVVVPVIPKVTPSVTPSSTPSYTAPVTTAPVTTKTVDPCTNYDTVADAAAAGYTCASDSSSHIQTGELNGSTDRTAIAGGIGLLGFSGAMLRRGFMKRSK